MVIVCFESLGFFGMDTFQCAGLSIQYDEGVKPLPSLYLATILAALIHGEERDEVLSPDWKPLRQLNDIKPLHPLIQEIAQGSFRQKQPPAIQGSGWVVKSLEASLWAFHNTDSFEEAVLKAVNLGDDADTTGAVCGQLAGAYWGESNIPESLRSGLARMDMLESALAGILSE